MFVLLLVLAVKGAQDMCKWSDGHGHSFDINQLKRSTNYQVSDTDTSMGMFNMVYEFNFCTSGVKCQNREVAALEALEVLGKLTENCDTLGMRDTQEIKLLNPSIPEMGISVTYSQGDMCFDVKDEKGLQSMLANDSQMSMTPRSVTFEITCAATNDDSFHVIDSTTCNIRLGINHTGGCSAGSQSGILSKLFFYGTIGFLLYIAAGTAYNIKQKQMSGAEAVPHIEVWRELPTNIVNGVSYLIHLILGYSRQLTGNANSTRGYATV